MTFPEEILSNKDITSKNRRTLPFLLLVAATTILVAWQLGPTWSLVLFSAGLVAVTVALVQATDALARANRRLVLGQELRSRREEFRTALDAIKAVLEIDPVGFGDVVRGVPVPHPFFDAIHQLANYTNMFGDVDTVRSAQRLAADMDGLRAHTSSMNAAEAAEKLNALKGRLLQEALVLRRSVRSGFDERLNLPPFVNEEPPRSPAG